MSARVVPVILCLLLMIVTGLQPNWLLAADPDKPNILFIAVDDLRPQTHAYGRRIMHTPNMDRLASQGCLFQRHYVQAPTCGASRYSLLSGQYPKRPVSLNNGAFQLFQGEHAPVSLPGWFRRNGYHTVQTGKISHSPDGFRDDRERIAENGVANSYRKAPHLHYSDPDDPEIPGAWDQFLTPNGPWQTGWGAFFAYDNGKTRNSGVSPAYERADVSDTGYPDGLMADAAVGMLRELSERRSSSDQPFFYAVGLYKPHLPFNAPAEYWDLYEPDEIDLSGVDPLRRRGGEFFGGYSIRPDDMEDEAIVREVIRGYLASVSYIDAQVGKLLDALDELDLADNTIVVLWGDHGWHLGELGYWGKHTLHEHSLRSALVVRAPGMEDPGEATDSIVGSIDLYPTLTEIAGLPTPDHLDGRSFAGLFREPQADPVGFAIGFQGNKQTLRTDTHRLIAKGDDLVLYDHTAAGEHVDVARDQPDTAQRMAQRLETLLQQRKAR